MDTFVLIAYIVGGCWMFRRSFKFGMTESDYIYEPDDLSDMGQLLLLSAAAAIVWPLVLIGGIALVIAKRVATKMTNTDV